MAQMIVEDAQNELRSAGKLVELTQNIIGVSRKFSESIPKNPQSAEKKFRLTEKLSGIV